MHGSTGSHPTPDIDKRKKALWFALMLANTAVDLLLPTVIFVLLAPTGLPPQIRLSIGGTLLGAKAIGGRIETGEFRWRLVVFTAVASNTALIGCYLAGAGSTASMVAGAVVAALIVIGDMARTRLRRTATHRIDSFAVLVLAEVIVGVVLTSISGDARFVLARTSLYIAIAGIVVLASAWTDHPYMRDALKPVAAKGDPLRAAGFDRIWSKDPGFRRIYQFVTATLGLVLLTDAVLRVLVIYSYPPDQAGKSSLLSGLPLFALIALWFLPNRTLLIPRARRLLDAEMAEQTKVAVA
ncbi:VC0807 family protein [Nocardia sp. NBC_01327]|uniref:VC0807 family protein n=1 Tax=Nocardia sp. NBC_01327 TaxID=2903593 RepID=UPI002E112D9C|nr:hypothetical protein OG326_20800 [Nocardia sp. NBC_01327]